MVNTYEVHQVFRVSVLSAREHLELRKALEIEEDSQNIVYYSSNSHYIIFFEYLSEKGKYRTEISIVSNGKKIASSSRNSMTKLEEYENFDNTYNQKVFTEIAKSCGIKSKDCNMIFLENRSIAFIVNNFEDEDNEKDTCYLVKIMTE